MYLQYAQDERSPPKGEVDLQFAKVEMAQLETADPLTLKISTRNEMALYVKAPDRQELERITAALTASIRNTSIHLFAKMTDLATAHRRYSLVFRDSLTKRLGHRKASVDRRQTVDVDLDRSIALLVVLVNGIIM